MNLQTIGRIASIFIGAAVLFGLEQGWGWAWYASIPVAVAAYTIARLAFAVLGASNPNPK